MSTVLEKSVTRDEDGSWAFQCPNPTDHPCGEPGGPGFRSSGWPTRKVAEARGAEHFAEHRGEAVTSTLEEFRAKHGLVVDDNTGAVSLADLED